MFSEAGGYRAARKRHLLVFRHSLLKKFMGSVATKVQHLPPVPVLLIK
jgi:nucleotide-binding universal stress UspA family protein